MDNNSTLSGAINKMKELVRKLNEAAFSYYVQDNEIMSNFEYDRLYDELMELEKSTGTVLPDSPTKSAGAGYKAVSKLEKSEHEFPTLSLDKTKDRYSLASWLGGMEGVLSWKLDGLTVVLTYEGGKLLKAVTRGSGTVGEVVTHNAVRFGGVPARIPFKGKLIIRGEAVMKYADFEEVNRRIPETEAKYKNPRNLASATVRLLDPEEAAKRPVTVYVFDLVYIDDGRGIKDANSKFSQFEWLEKQGFKVVDHVLVTPLTVVSELERFEKELPGNDYPTDGLVLILDDEKYGKSLGSTGKFPRNGIAFKWRDEAVETRIREVEWSASRTGLLNPVAVFDPVEIEGTTVSRASVHNVSIARSLKLAPGSGVRVYKANLIIPQIAETFDPKGETFVPDECPVCGFGTAIRENDGIETLYCENPDCPAKHIGRFSHFVARDAVNVNGLSEATLETFIDAGFVRRFSDLYHLDRFRDNIVNMEGFGQKSYDNLMASVEASRRVKFSALLNAVGISGIGKDMAKQISRFLGENACGRFCEMVAERFDFSVIEGIGAVINDNIYAWADDAARFSEFEELLPELMISDDVVARPAGSGGRGAEGAAGVASVEAGASVDGARGGNGDEGAAGAASADGVRASREDPVFGKTFVITGALVNFVNRDQLVDFIEERGGKVAGSVSSKTSYLITNDVNSGSGKNKKAKELGVPVISEADFLTMCGDN